VLERLLQLAELIAYWRLINKTIEDLGV